MTQTQLLAVLLAGLYIVFLVIYIVTSIISVTVNKHRKSHSKCSLEEYAERHSCCYYCTYCEYVIHNNLNPSYFCKITGKRLLLINRKRKCPIFDNMYKGDDKNGY